MLLLLKTVQVRAPLEDLDLGLDADFLKLSLHDLSHVDALLALVRPDLALEAVGETGLGQKLLGKLEVLLVLGHFLADRVGDGDGHEGRGDHADLGQTLPDGLVDQGRVERGTDGLAHAHVGERRLGDVEAEVGDRRLGLLVERQLLVVTDAVDVVADDRVSDVDALGLELDRAVRGLGDGADFKVLVRGLLAPEVVVALKDVLVALLPLHELERTGAHGGRAGRAVAVAGGLGGLLVEDRAPAVRERAEERVVGLLQHDNDGVVVKDLDVGNVLRVGADLGALVGGGAHDRVAHVAGLQLFAVVELDALAEHELVLGGRQELPALGQAGNEVAVLVAENQRVVQLEAAARAGNVIVADRVHRRGVVLIGDDQTILGSQGRRGSKAQNQRRKRKYRSLFHVSDNPLQNVRRPKQKVRRRQRRAHPANLKPLHCGTLPLFDRADPAVSRAAECADKEKI